MTTYGFIGAGNMARALITGLLAAGVQPDSIAVTSAHGSAARLAQETGVRDLSAREVVHRCDVLTLAVKPHVIPSVLRHVQDALAEHRPLIISIAAGISLQALEDMAPGGARVVRAMPNMAARVRESMTAVALGKECGEAERSLAFSLLTSVGRTVEIDDADFSAFTALAGSSPAVVYELIEALSRAAVAAGIPKHLAVDIATQAVRGSALTLQADPAATPTQLIDSVCSPGGTTIAGLNAMEAAGFSAAVIRGFEATVERDGHMRETH